MGKLIDETGNEYGFLKVLKRDPEPHTKPYWLCLCKKCGNIVSIYGSSLRKGITTQCKKCASQEAAQKRNKDLYANILHSTFNYLTVIDQDLSKGHKAGEARYWKCQCQCGKIISLSTHQITSKMVYSCGCMKRSKGEEEIARLLTQYNIPFEEQKMFEECRFPLSGRKARFDFFVNNCYVIEFDGKQHDVATGGLFTQDIVEAIQERDLFKNKWCKENNIPIIRIKYNQLETLTINDLLLKKENENEN